MSQRIVAQVSLEDGAGLQARDEVVAVLDAAVDWIEGCRASHAGAHLDLSVGGGDITWDLLLESPEAVEAFCARVKGCAPAAVMTALGAGFSSVAPRVVGVDLAIPEPLGGRVGRPGLVGVKRTLWLRVEPGTDPGTLACFEAETPILAEAVPAIRNWRWSRIRTSDPHPMVTRWTHLWEQEFETLDGLQIDYMSTPAHWGYIDRWFDPEMPDRIVDLWLAHLACPETAPVLSWDD